MSSTRNHARSGARAVLGISACGLALSLGMRTAFVQADNYALAVAILEKLWFGEVRDGAA